jgi:hypothetical protein
MLLSARNGAFEAGARSAPMLLPAFDEPAAGYEIKMQELDLVDLVGIELEPLCGRPSPQAKS